VVEVAGEAESMPQPLDPARSAGLDRLARVGRLLVASDYDGVLAPMVTDPARAFPLPAARTALTGLATLPGTTVALVSGRARRDLAALARLPAEVLLVGSHGSEFADGGVRLDPAQAALRARLEAALRKLVRDRPGVWLEAKPAAVVVHTRTAAAEVGAAARSAAEAGPGSWPGVHVTTGKEVVELAVVETHKGTAVEALRARAEADAVLFLGDDVTDENAFAVLREPDVGVKVGPGRTRARFRVADPDAAVAVLERLRDARATVHADRTG
jgi:trehalose-phosphatase